VDTRYDGGGWPGRRGGGCAPGSRQACFRVADRARGPADQVAQVACQRTGQPACDRRPAARPRAVSARQLPHRPRAPLPLPRTRVQHPGQVRHPPPPCCCEEATHPPTHPPTHAVGWLVGGGGDSLRAVDTLCVETQGLIGHYELIKAGLVFLSSSPPPPLALTAGGPVNDARSNLHYTRRQLDRTLEIPDKVLLHRSFAPPPPTLKGADALLLTRSRRSGRCWRTKSTSCRPITRSRTWRSSEKGPYAMLGDSPLQSCWKESSPLISSHCIHTFRAARGNTEQYEVIEKIFTDVSKLYERA